MRNGLIQSLTKGHFSLRLQLGRNWSQLVATISPSNELERNSKEVCCVLSKSLICSNLVYLSIFSGLAALMSDDVARNL